MNGVHRNGLTRLAYLLRVYRGVRQLSRDTRTVAAQIGISAATLNRIERGHAMDAATMLKVLNWLMERETDIV